VPRRRLHVWCSTCFRALDGENKGRVYSCERMRRCPSASCSCTATVDAPDDDELAPR